MKKIWITSILMTGFVMGQIPKIETENNQPFEAKYPYKETGTIKINANKREWVRRVGDTVGGTLIWTPSGKYAVLYNDLGGTRYAHFFFCFKDDGTGWMESCSVHKVVVDYYLANFAITGSKVNIQLATQRSSIYIAPYEVALDGPCSKVNIPSDFPNQRNVEPHQAGLIKYPRYTDFGSPPPNK